MFMLQAGFVEGDARWCIGLRAVLISDDGSLKGMWSKGTGDITSSSIVSV